MLKPVVGFVWKIQGAPGLLARSSQIYELVLLTLTVSELLLCPSMAAVSLALDMPCLKTAL
jgi:hypothetical protein